MIKYLLANWINVPATPYLYGMSIESRDLKQVSSLLMCKKAYITLQFQEN